MKGNNAITIVALIITIIVLLILAGVSIAMLAGENGILGNAEKAIGKSENAQIEENLALSDFENRITTGNSGGTVNGSRNEEQTPKMISPKHLLTAALPNSETGTRPIGTYKASTADYTKTNTEAMSNYLSFEENTGWTVLKSGWYFIRLYAHSSYTNTQDWSYVQLQVNGSTVAMGTEYIGSSHNAATITETFPIYLEQGSVIDCVYQTKASSIWSVANFIVYAQFE